MQKLAEICIKRPVFATMLILMLVVLGLDSYRKLGVDFLPKVEFPIVTITTPLRGASPEEVETQVTKRIEEAINTVAGIDELASNSFEGLSRVTVTFVLEKDAEVAAQEVRDKVSSILGQLPKDAEPPVVEKLATDASPILNVVVSSPRDLRETTKIVDDLLKKNLESLSGVGQVRLIGDRRRQIQVSVDGEKLYSYGLNIDQIRGALTAQNVEVPGGRLDEGSRESSVRTLGRVEKPADFGRLIIANSGGAPLRVNDVGSVTDGVEEARTLARLDGVDAVVLAVRKQSGTNSLDVINRVKERIGEVRKAMPPDMKIAYAGDQSGFIQSSFEAVQGHLILGGVLAGVVVLLFMRNWRSTLIAAIAIPASIISTYTLMNWMGFTLNQISMLALTLMVGIVIDDAIVVLENIFRFMEEKKMSPVDAAIAGTKDIGLAVLATTLSLAVVFLPVATMSGIVGRFMSSFGYTAAFAVMVSLLVSFTLTPMLCSRFLKVKPSDGHSTKDNFVFRIVDRPYQAMLRWSMNHRWVVVVAALITCFSIGPLMKRVGTDFLPSDDQSEFEVLVRMPPGSALSGSSDVLRQVEAELKQLPGVENLLTQIGADVQRQVDRGSVLVELVPVEKRKESQKQVMLMARERLRKFKDLVIGVQLPAVIQGAGPNADYLYILQGPDLGQLEKYANTLKSKLRELPGVNDVDSSYETGKPELRVLINRDKASDLNVNVAAIATAMRTLVGGDEQATTYREGDDRYDVMLRVDKEFRNSPEALSRLYVPSVTLGNVPLANIAHVVRSVGPLAIDRYNRQRQILISASITGDQALGTVVTATEDAIREMNFGPEYHARTMGKTKELARAGKSYLFAFGLSIIFMYMILASQFESFVDPITILLSLPLSIPFALISLILMKENFSIVYSSVGILVLFGIVKKNSILQVDHIKKLRAEGMPRAEAILKGCEDRLRPILMTTMALVAGMMPLALGSGAGSGTRRTVAIVVIGGQSLCLLLTLLATPVFYSLFDDIAAFFTGLGRKVRTPAVATTLMLMLAVILPAQPRVGVNGEQRKISLNEAIQLALENNLELETERSNVQSAKVAIEAAKGVFDPFLRYTPSFEDRNTPTASVLQGSSGNLNEKFFNNNFELRKKTGIQGGALTATFDNSRQTSTNPFTSLTPLTSARLGVAYIQPLLRNRTIDRERAELVIRNKQVGISELDFELRSIDVVARVEQAYWDLVAARQDLEVKTDAVKLAQEQLERNRRMIDSGTLAPIELSSSQAELERRRDTLLSALGVVTELENQLKTLLTKDRDAEMWAQELVPTNTAIEAAPAVKELEPALKVALSQRPELKHVDQRLEVNDIDTRVNREQLKPLVNLVGSYTLSGLAGKTSTGENPFTASNVSLYERLNLLSSRAGLPAFVPPSFGSLPDFLIGGYGSTLSNIFVGRYPTYQAGLQIDIPIRNRQAKAAVEQSLIVERRLKIERARAEQAIGTQVRNALQSLETSRQRIVAAEAGSKAAKDRLDSEVRLYQTGESTNFFVLTRQNEFLDARRRELLAKLDFNKASARFLQSVGETLKSRSIRIRP